MTKQGHTAHTQLPWYQGDKSKNKNGGRNEMYIYRQGGNCIASLIGFPKEESWITPEDITLEEAEANADFIVTACNAHDGLVADNDHKDAVIRECVEALESLQGCEAIDRLIEYARKIGIKFKYPEDRYHTSFEYETDARDTYPARMGLVAQIAEEALAKARGEQ